MYTVAQFDPTIDAFASPGQFVPVVSNILNLFPSGTLVVKNRSYFDLAFQATDGRSFYVEQQTGRAFSFDDLTTWRFSYKPINQSGFFSSNGGALPYQQVTIELYPPGEELIEKYPFAFPLFGLPPTDIISRNSQLFKASSGVQTSPASGNIPIALFQPSTPNTTLTITILSVQVFVSVASSSAAQIIAKHTTTDPALTNPMNGFSTNGGISATPVLKTEWQNTNLAVIAGADLLTGIVSNNTTVTELLYPGVLTLPSFNFATKTALSGGYIFWLQPAVATTYCWNVLWKEEVA